MRLKKVDTVVLRSDLARIDTQWTELLTRIPVVQEKLHQVLSHATEWLSCFTTNWIMLSAASLHVGVFHRLLSACLCLHECDLFCIKVHLAFQIQMEKLASRHAISELFNWISLMENVTQEDEENLKSAVGSNVIQDYLQKYKVVYL